jgi:hypothetical protein
MNGVIRRARATLALAGAAALGSLALAASAAADTGPSAGAFVIGDQSAVVGSQVTFWGAQWWKDNSLSAGAAPAAFKGFADTATLQCGQQWTTDPGNSSAPPAAVGPVTADGLVPMVVSSNVTKSGSVISGDTAEVVLVRVDPGYAPDPGHPGTGTVVDVVCSTGGGIVVS